jgi:hypothetical protein
VARETADTPQPTVLVRSPYGRKQFVGLLAGRLLAERGFQVVIQSVRGTFGSGGDFDPFDERADGLATLAWLRTQPWHEGRVGGFGPSYLGLVQWAIAEPAGDELAAMAIQVSASQFYDETYAGGSVSLETVASWLVLVAFQERRLAPVAINRGLRGLRDALAETRLDEIDVRITGGEVVWLRDALEHPGRDSEHWLRRDYSESVPGVTAPVSFVGGWHDILLPWMLEDFKALQAAGRRTQLLIGPWTHISTDLAAAGHREGIAWLRGHLLGDDRLIRDSKVRVMVTGDGGGWRELERWPPASRPRSLYLGHDDELSHALTRRSDPALAGADRRQRPAGGARRRPDLHRPAADRAAGGDRRGVGRAVGARRAAALRPVRAPLRGRRRRRLAQRLRRPAQRRARRRRDRARRGRAGAGVAVADRPPLRCGQPPPRAGQLGRAPSLCPQPGHGRGSRPRRPGGDAGGRRRGGARPRSPVPADPAGDRVSAGTRGAGYSAGRVPRRAER